MQLRSVKHEPLLKQFYVYFFVASLIPFAIFSYLIFHVVNVSKIDASIGDPKLLLIIAGVFSALGFWGTRSFLVKIVNLSNRLKDQSLDKFDRKLFTELSKGEGEIAQVAKVFNEITLNLEANVKELQETKKTLYQVLNKVGTAFASVENFDLLTQVILETIVEALGAKRGIIFSVDEARKILKPKAVVGVDKNVLPQEVQFGEGALGWVVKEKKSLSIPLLDERETESVFSSPLISVPLIVHDKVWGAIALSGKKGSTNFLEDDLKILSNLAYQIAVSFENIALSTEAEKTYFETISALALAVEAKDHYSRGHSERVAEYAIRLAKYLGLSERDLHTLRDAARLHDIGKIGITDDVLKKQGQLTADERKIMNKHPLIGESIVGPLKTFSHIVDPIKHHHELLDGSGYPDGLKEDQISLITRILTVADIFDALSTDRPYRKALSAEEIKKEFDTIMQVGKVDKNVVTALFKLIEENKIK